MNLAEIKKTLAHFARARNWDLVHQVIIVLMLAALLIPCLISPVKAEDKVFTNDDLLKYGGGEPAPVTKPAIPSDRRSYQQNSHRIQEQPGVVVQPVNSNRLIGPVKMKVSGCQTLQEGIDGKEGSIAETVIEVNGRGRTVEEICDTLGLGCQSCSMANR